MPRLLYLCVHPRNSSPSQRYRFEQFEPYLREHGFEVEYASALTADEVPVFHGRYPASRKGAVALKALMRRAWSVRPRFSAKRFDAVIVQREAFFLFGAWSEWLAHLQAPLILDFDDAIWMHVVSEANRRFAWLKNADKVRRTVAMATTVIAGNQFLADWAKQYSDSVEVIPTCADTDVYVPDPSRRGAQITIGWCGSPSTLANVRPMLPALERVVAKYGDRVRVRIMGDPNFRHEPLNLVGEAWGPEREIPFLQSIDIGIMPLLDDEWSKGKCALKGLTSMACGVPNVMSPVGINPTVIQDGQNGLLARTNDDWVDALSRLIEDDGFRLRLGEAARVTVEQNYSVRRWRETLRQTIARCIGQS